MKPNVLTVLLGTKNKFPQVLCKLEDQDILGGVHNIILQQIDLKWFIASPSTDYV